MSAFMDILPRSHVGKALRRNLKEVTDAKIHQEPAGNLKSVTG